MTGTDRYDIAARPASVPDLFRSILFPCDDAPLETAQQPDCFRDLNLDQVVASVVADREEYELDVFFHAPLRTVDEVAYRQEVFRDLEDAGARAAVEAFAEGARVVRRYLTLATKQHYRLERQRWLLDAVLCYCETVGALRDALAELDLRSRGLSAWRDRLEAYVRGRAFGELTAEARQVRDGLARVRYALRVKGLRVTVSAYEDEPDYGVDVAQTFERFRQGRVDEHVLKLADPGSMDHVEAQIADRVARLFPHEFRALDEFSHAHRSFVDPEVSRFDRWVQFYLAWRELKERLSARGIAFCHPEVSDTAKDVLARQAVDVALAEKLAGSGVRPVPNDFELSGAERILVVSGPNQGGKTTFARMVGQLHYLAALGVPVPAERARVFLPDRVFTHFEQIEDISTLRGKLDDELVRVREILAEATGDSVVILNEIFASTTLDDALYLGGEVLSQILDRDCLAVCVTFLDELSTLDESTVSMVAQVAPDDPSQRTFEVIRTPADGRAHAWALAEKYGLSYERLRVRIVR